MTKKMCLAVLFVVAAAVTRLAATTPEAQLSAREVSDAIARAGKQTTPPVCVGRNVAGEFMICMQGPEQRIETAAVLAKQAHRRFRADDVPGDMKARTWRVVVRPIQPGLVDGRPVRTPEAESLGVLSQSQPQAAAIAPLSVARVPYSWDNAVGLTLKSQGLTAIFDPAMLPSGGLEFVVTTEGGRERRYVVSESERAQIR